jgi:serine/threonine protein kinase
MRVRTARGGSMALGCKMASLESSIATTPNVSTDSDPDSHVGRVLGQFRIEELMGRGGMGTVYRGVQLSVDRPVAVKLIAGDAENNPDYVLRFRREAKAMAQLRHPNTVRLLDFGVTEQGRMFMVMELLRGTDLEKRLEKSGPLDLTQALRIVRQIAQSLSEAHAVGIVHRDLKPGNIFLAEVEGGDCFVKVMDFGVAGFKHDGTASTLTMKGAVLGTAAYMSPEQAQGEVVDARADLYSLGVILFEMLAGRPPFQGSTPVSLLIAHVSDPPPRLLELCPDLAELERVQPLLDKLLAKKPEERPSSAADVITWVDALLLEMGSPITGPSGIDVAPKQRTPRPQRRMLVAAASLLLVTASLLFAWRRPHDLTWLQVQAQSRLGLLQQRSQDVASALDEWRHSQPASVTIASVPSGALVQLEGAELGKTPYQLQLKRKTLIELALPGHATQRVTVDPTGDPNVVINLSPLPPLRSAGALAP